nr:MAG TPA: hypothetical protein [Caudoviricetes sp.]
MKDFRPYPPTTHLTRRSIEMATLVEDIYDRTFDLENVHMGPVSA